MELKSKKFPREAAPRPPRSLYLWRAFRNLVSIYLSSVPSASWAIDSEPIWAGGTIVKYLCDFAEGCLLRFRLNTGMEKKNRGLGVLLGVS